MRESNVRSRKTFCPFVSLYLLLLFLLSFMAGSVCQLHEMAGLYGFGGACNHIAPRGQGAGYGGHRIVLGQNLNIHPCRHIAIAQGAVSDLDNIDEGAVRVGADCGVGNCALILLCLFAHADIHLRAALYILAAEFEEKLFVALRIFLIGQYGNEPRLNFLAPAPVARKNLGICPYFEL